LYPKTAVGKKENDRDLLPSLIPLPVNAENRYDAYLKYKDND
jgi:hypothetical protein